jgi:hypothetical protein
MSTDEVIGKFDLVNINTPDGDFGFMIGNDGIFTDVNDKKWYGSQLISVGKMEYAINGKAPSGEITLSFFQDPDAPDVVQKVKELGVDYVAGRLITFFYQPFSSIEEMYAPVAAPYPVATRVMRTLRFTSAGAQNRAISLSFESAWEYRRRMRRRVYNTVDHELLIGEPDPSLEYIPTELFEEQKLFG